MDTNPVAVENVVLVAAVVDGDRDSGIDVVVDDKDDEDSLDFRPILVEDEAEIVSESTPSASFGPLQLLCCGESRSSTSSSSTSPC